MNKNRVTNHKHHVPENKHNVHRLSPVLMEMAKRELEELETRSDQAFFLRADMDKKLSSL